MKLFIDNQIVKMLAHDSDKILKNPIIRHPDNTISFQWPSLLEYLDLGSIISNLPPFDENHPYYAATVTTLLATDEEKVVFYIYDRLFAENLNQIAALPEINASFLLQAIKEKRRSSSNEIENILAQTLNIKEGELQDKSAETMHHLILYLAWDRMCVCMASLFDYQSTDQKFLKNINTLTECLIDSYQHISQQSRTSPGIYRMLEAVFFYQLREENIQKHTLHEQKLLSQGFKALKAPNELMDFFYIDNAIIDKENKKSEMEVNSECYLTLDPAEMVNFRLDLANLLLDKLKEQDPRWAYGLHPKKIINL